MYKKLVFHLINPNHIFYVEDAKTCKSWMLKFAAEHNTSILMPHLLHQIWIHNQFAKSRTWCGCTCKTLGKWSARRDGSNRTAVNQVRDPPPDNASGAQTEVSFHLADVPAATSSLTQTPNNGTILKCFSSDNTACLYLFLRRPRHKADREWIKRPLLKYTL